MNKNVKKMMLVGIITSLQFLAPVEVIFFSYKLLSLSQIYFLYSIFSISIFALEIPTGFFGDRFGFKVSISLGFICGIIGTLGFVFGKGFYMIAFSYFFMALMVSLISGSDDALIYDSLVECGKEKEYENVYSKISSFTYLSILIGGLLGGIVAKYNIILNPIFDGIGLIVGLFLVTTIKSPPSVSVSKEEKKSFHCMMKESKSVITILLVAGLFMVSTLLGTKFSQPLMADAGISIAYFGIYTSICSVINSIASFVAPKLKKVPFKLIVLIPTMLILLIGLSRNGWFVALLFITAACRSIGDVRISAELNATISSNYRATINSIKNLLFRFFYAAIILLSGIIADYDIYAALITGGCILAFLLIIALFLYYRKIMHNKSTIL